MRAIWLEKHTKPGEIGVTDVDSPILLANQALIHIHAAGVNPSDVKYAAGIVPTTPLPRIPGRDFAGIIVEGPADLIGDEVFGSGGDLGIKRNGTHAEYIELPLDAFAPKPKTLSMAEAASVGVPYVTAFKAVAELGAVLEDETILILGGSGAVGSAACQLAKWRGANVIATTRRGESAPAWNAFVDRVINLPDDDIVKTVMEFTDGRGADVVINGVGGILFDDAVRSLAHKGRMVCFSATGNRQVTFDLMDFYKRELTWSGLDTLELSATECAVVLELLGPGFDDAQLGIDVAHILPLERASEAYQLVDTGGAGKVALSMVESPL